MTSLEAPEMQLIGLDEQLAELEGVMPVVVLHPLGNIGLRQAALRRDRKGVCEVAGRPLDHGRRRQRHRRTVGVLLDLPGQRVAERVREMAYRATGPILSLDRGPG